MLVPMVIESSARGERAFDIYSTARCLRKSSLQPASPLSAPQQQCPSKKATRATRASRWAVSRAISLPPPRPKHHQPILTPSQEVLRL